MKTGKTGKTGFNKRDYIAGDTMAGTRRDEEEYTGKDWDYIQNYERRHSSIMIEKEEIDYIKESEKRQVIERAAKIISSNIEKELDTFRYLKRRFLKLDKEGKIKCYVKPKGEFIHVFYFSQWVDSLFDQIEENRDL